MIYKLNLHYVASSQRPKIIVENNGNWKIFEAAASIKRPRPPFGSPNESPIVEIKLEFYCSVKRPSSTWNT